MFMGEYNHTVDEKGRLIIPVKFRDELGSEFVVTKGLDGCLFAYDLTEWRVLEEKLRALPLTNKDARAFARFMLAGAASVEIDKQGRILLPQVLRNFAGLEKDVVLIGVASRIEIWNKEKWEDASYDADAEELAEKMENLGI
ncbi:MAG: division/cell wall cluster transcriptional repressor MraZ [Lachnospiraceae bacterium]|jgi:MraZ protein|nr:division/cell wall cluster transcriptional repressor MraZ [Lachnospiraceae bacterium]MCR5117710.1 division/cell wall cluster transcriptional repressor MraZ [Lachnospiraceae bacterium]